jgi:hypothetical protein
MSKYVVAGMKERRASGATHSFRLNQRASLIVDDITHPRRHGGKSAKVSEAIEWYFSPIIDRDENGKFVRDHPSPSDLLANIAGLQSVIESLSKSTPRPPTWRDRLRARFGRHRA